MKKFISQIMAAVLAFCMIAAIVPTVPAAAADGDIVLNFDLGSFRQKISAVDTASLGGWTWNEAKTGSYIATQINSTATSGVPTWYTFQGSGNGLRVTFTGDNPNGQRIGFNFNVAESGWYDLSESAIKAMTLTGNLATTAEIDLISNGAYKKGVATIVSPTEETTETWSAATVTSEKVYLTQGANTLIVRSTSIAANNTFALVKISFKKTTEPTAEAKKDVVLDFTGLTVGKSDDASLISDVSEYDAWNWTFNGDLTSAGYKTAISTKRGGCFYVRKIHNTWSYYFGFATAYGNLVLNFKADKAGWYKIDATNSSAISMGATETGTTNVYVGKEGEKPELAAVFEGEGTTSGATLPVTAYPVWLEEGENIIVFKGVRAANPQYDSNAVKLEKLTFSAVSDSEIPEEDDEPYAQTIEFNTENIGSYVATDAMIEFHGWEVDKTGTSTDLYANLSNPDSQRYPQFFKTYAAGGRSGFPLGHMAAYFNWGEDSLVLTFKINNEVEGKYDISAVMYDYPNSMAEGTVSVNGTQVGTYVNGTTTETAYTEVTKELGKKVKLNKGANTITFTTTNDKNGFNLVKLVLTPNNTPDPVVITNAAIFGDVSAYITKTETGSFKFTALAAINDTAYTEVGFYIDGDKYAVEGGNVYKVVTVNGVETKVAEFFPTTTPTGANDPYIFFSSKEFAAKPGSVEFTPYAVPVNGAEITGHTYTVTLS